MLRYILCAFSVLSILAASHSHADSHQKESDIKAAIIFNLARFTDWPESSHHNEGNHFSLCSHASKGMETALDGLAGKTLHGRTLEIVHIKDLDDVSDMCEIFFISNLPDRLDFNSLHSKGMLTMSDHPGFTYEGGGMSIQRQGKKIRFSINSAALKDAGVKPSSKILSLAVEPPR